MTRKKSYFRVEINLINTLKFTYGWPAIHYFEILKVESDGYRFSFMEVAGLKYML